MSRVKAVYLTVEKFFNGADPSELSPVPSPTNHCQGHRAPTMGNLVLGLDQSTYAYM